LFYEYKAPFIPDWWMVFLPTAISGIVDVFQKGQVASWSLTGTGQVSFPSGSDDDPSLFFRNNGASAITVRIYASTGYPPPSFVPPVTVAKPLSAKIQSEASWYSAADTNDFTKPYLHIGRYAYIFIGCLENSYGATNLSVGNVQLGGTYATKLVSGWYHQSYSTIETSIWLADIAGNGVLTLGVDFVPPGPAGESAWFAKALSFDDGIRPGQTDYGGAEGSYPGSAIGTTLEVYGQSPESTIYALAYGQPVAGTFVETSGAYPWIASGMEWVGAHRGEKRIGSGQALFQYYESAAMQLSACCVEITTS
jgi:hypothetical protein